MSLAQRIQAECLSIAEEAGALSAAYASPRTRPAPAKARDRAGALLARIADVRARLDAVSVAGVFSNTADGVLSILAAGAWERNTRTALVALTRSLSDLQAAADAQVTSKPRAFQTHVVALGDTLQSIAQARLGDWQLWPRIAELNGLSPAATLTPGASLTIPSAGRGA